MVCLLADELGPPAGPAQMALESIKGTSLRLCGLVAELLAYARTGSNDLAAEPVDLDELVAAVRAELSELINSHQAQVEVGHLGQITAEKTLLHQAIQNLVVNAVTYADPARPPRVRITATHGHHTGVISVTDNGPGIAAQERHSVLKPFVRGSAGHQRPGGSGLGLAICQRVAHRHGGWLEIADAAPVGTEVKLVLPRTGAPAEPTVEPVRQSDG